MITDEHRKGAPMEVSDYKNANHNSFKPEDCVIAGNSKRKEGKSHLSYWQYFLLFDYI